MSCNEIKKLEEDIKSIVTIEMSYLSGSVGHMLVGREEEAIRNVRGRMLALIDERFKKVKG